MTFFKDLLNPPPTKGDNWHDIYNFFNSSHAALSSLGALSNQSVLSNSNFATLGPGGLTPTTQADGDDFEFIGDWFVVGATAANYTITPTAYPTNSTVKSASDYYVKVQVTSFNNNPFYFYQRQAATVRKYQEDYFTYGLQIKNNQNKSIKVRTDIYSYYDPSNQLKTGRAIYLQPNQVTTIASNLQTQSLQGLTVGAGNYTEFRFDFIDLYDGTADIDIYLIKCEFGTISTPL
jgi:hypothetical protein